MSRIRKTLVVLSLVLSVTAIQVPASAEPSLETCTYSAEIAGHKYEWHVPICF